MNPPMKHCKGKLPSGARCTRRTKVGVYCWYHDPALKRERSKASQAGGFARARARVRLQSPSETHTEERADTAALVNAFAQHAEAFQRVIDLAVDHRLRRIFTGRT